MVKIYEFNAPQPLGVEEFFAEFDRIEHPSGSDAFLAESARLLANLNSDKALIRHHIERHGGIRSVRSTFASPQYFVLGRHYSRFGPIGLRVNYWLPIEGGQFYSRERDMYSYELAHNHDFRFLTVGHFGPGYVTDLCEVDPDSIKGIPGEKVELKNHRTEQLSYGKVLYFEPFTDVHIQHPPKQLSISINLILGVENWKREQYEFDLRSSRLVGGVDQSPVGRTMACIDFATYFADDTTKGLLQTFANDRFARVRDAASRALSKI